MSESGEVRPSWKVDVQIGFGTTNYVSLADWLYGYESVEWWTALGDLLGGRPGWYCELGTDGLYWHFGAMQASLLNIGSPVEDGRRDKFPKSNYSLFDYEADEVVHFESIDDLRTWLEANEPRFTDYIRGRYSEWASADDWAVLRMMTWRINVEYDGAAWIATVPNVPADATFANDLPQALRQAGELICAAFGAPARIAELMSLEAYLDVEACSALTS
jgi:hypothetical protein